MTNVLAVRELLEPVTVLVAREAYKTANDAESSIAITIGDHTHFDEMSGIDPLLQHIEDTILAKHLYR